MKQHFTTREVAKILSLPEWRIRSCVRAGFIAPGRGADRRNVFTFHDLLLLRTTKGLLNARVPLGRIRRILQSLKKQLPEDKNLWNVSVFADGKRVVVKNGSSRWQPDSGQFLFNFAAEELAKKMKLPVKKRRRSRSGARTIGSTSPATSKGRPRRRPGAPTSARSTWIPASPRRT